MVRPFAGLLAAAALLPLGGCTGGDAPAPSGRTPTAGAAASPANPIAEAAGEFLDAVVNGDTPRATGMLTPAAQAQFANSQQAFASPDSRAPTFRVGEVRRISPTEAGVQCLLNDESGHAEMCCLLKRVAGRWRVSGIAYETGPGQAPVILNFEEDGAAQPPRAETWAKHPAADAAPAARTATRSPATSPPPAR